MTCLLYRDKLGEEEEFEAAIEVWGEDLYRFRSQIPSSARAIGRYSVLPHYDELEEELALKDCQLAHPLEVHEKIADLQWYKAMKELTPDTWFDEGWKTVPECEHGWVVKGKTNSRKWQWNKMMYAGDREQLKGIIHRLRNDSRISEQGLAIREYVPLEKVGQGINGLPLGNEWRCFFVGDDLLISGFYWAIAECAPEMGDTPDGAVEVAEEAARRFNHQTLYDEPFFVVDVAKTQEGDWIVIELNDGQMSGLSMIDPTEFYQALREKYHE